MTPLTLDVRRVREAKGMTQAELARRADIRPATLVEIEKGRTTSVDFDVLDRIARALDVPPGVLIVERGG